MQKIQDIIDLIEKSIKDEPDLLLTWWNIIKDWFDSRVDEYRDILDNSKNWLANYQNTLIEKTGIKNLKIKYTNISGYFIEIPKSFVSKAPEDFIQKQTLVNASRYVTQDLINFEKKFLEASSYLNSREYELFQEIRAEILEGYSEIKNLSKKTSFIDFEVSLSNLAYFSDYNKPKITKDYKLDIKNARHPVVEQTEKDFVSNDLELTKDNFVNIITWPNMWWKSTFLRQNALIILMAHLGSYIPASSWTIPITDRIFSRIWASDNLYFGQSTFMLEMQEVANIINNSSSNSFVIIDEVGRGTSTFDGMSLAWGILKENHDKIKAKTLFATHYHELIDESKSLHGVKNFSVSVWENNWELVFLRKIIPWGIKKSFGLEVAKLAWINSSIIDEAKKMLKILEKNSFSNSQLSMDLFLNPKNENRGLKDDNLEVKKVSQVEEKLKKTDINSLTPLEALNFLSEVKGSLED